ncbi:hypothetical protein ACFLZR_01845 [Candidatus Neomarinimicrobiota bacterium]
MTLLIMASCTAGPNQLVNTARDESTVAGFWLGLWHGFIVLFTFILSLFKDSIAVYEVHNNGGWYNFGFVLGVMMFFSGGQKSTRSWPRKSMID